MSETPDSPPAPREAPPEGAPARAGHKRLIRYLVTLGIVAVVVLAWLLWPGPVDEIMRYAPPDAQGVLHVEDADVLAKALDVLGEAETGPVGSADVKALEAVAGKVTTCDLFFFGDPAKRLGVLRGTLTAETLAEALKPQEQGAKPPATLRKGANGRHFVTWKDMEFVVIFGAEADDVTDDVVLVGTSDVVTDELVASLGARDEAAEQIEDLLGEVDTDAPVWLAAVEPTGSAAAVDEALAAPDIAKLASYAGGRLAAWLYPDGSGTSHIRAYFGPDAPLDAWRERAKESRDGEASKDDQGFRVMLEESEKGATLDVTMTVDLFGSAREEIRQRKRQAELDQARQSLARVHRALAAGDKSAFLACFEANDRQARVLEAMYDAFAAETALQRAFADAYDAQDETVTSALLRRLADASWLEKVTMEPGEQSTQAIATLGEDHKLHLVKARATVSETAETRPTDPRPQRVWKIDAEPLIDPDADDEQIDGMVAYYDALAAAGAKLTERVGALGESAASIRDKWANAQTRAVVEHAP
ncbi:MAG: hypothetical protein KGY99_08475 [Phycisphaerae bacterium]|nr:hypothetical protein [Phycisphaerae bacterium]